MNEQKLNMVPVFYSPLYVGSGYAFDTTRKSKWVADSLSAQPVPGIDLRVPHPLTREQITGVHCPDYVLAVEKGEPRSLAESQGFSWDAGLWPMVLASNGGVVQAALVALHCGVAGSLSSGLHHARYGQGRGFCTFNGLVIAAHAALAAGAKSVLILDLDAHCGGGTHSLIKDAQRIWQIDVSVSNFDSYVPSERTSLHVLRDAAAYLSLIVNQLREVESHAPRFDLCLYNAGMDPSEDCDIGGISGMSREILGERERIVFDWCKERRVPVAFVLAGGYIGERLNESGLVELHRLTLSAAARMNS